MRILFIFLIAVPTLTSCGNGKTGKTSTGIKYELFQNKSGNKVQPNDVLYLRYSMLADDSLMSTNISEPLPELGFFPDVKKEPRKLSPIEESFGLMEVGDSIKIFIPIDSMGAPGTRPPGLEKTKFIVYKILIEKRLSNTEVEKVTKGVADKVKGLFEKTKANTINYSATSSGLKYIILEEGNGSVITQGKKVTTNYYGILAADGVMFDNSYQRGLMPFTFEAMTGQVIPGWDEGMGLLKKGSKALFYIPSALAYGAEGAGGGAIPADADLMFYLEILDVN
jgi:FKBP-type peptidyl-prolyl cis-trans isomerase